ncbi:hypothetical protein GCM10011351_19200 [Paraliobacillus quinghaiensis]|uniref:DUF3231 family protein n=1 Tax=Paraliobacillus quinghaiensis TaxID=470815 RepID=A0A917TQI3_9BACI|nr:DUF3231 family protein [Paraliobacillus quinghaiensis]GGM33331.1 hypothetical protein GCM10011351_19200 [Paraliobacillus quinghaiensis]
MPERSAITSSELGVLWLTYQEDTMILRILEYFIEKADDEKAKEIMNNLYGEIDSYVGIIKETLENEGAVIPIGFTTQDVKKEVPKLYDNGFDIMFVRLLKQISMGLHSLNITMTYREDIVLIIKELTTIAQKYYNLCTQYLLKKGLLVKSPHVSMPTSVEFVKDKHYLSGLSANPFSEKRSLNTVEVAQIHHSIESNITGLQMIIGFAQCANTEDVKNYFNEGAELAKSMVKELSEIFLQSGLQAPQTAGGNATRSTLAPFSDKLMLYCTSLFCSFSMGSGSLGTAFSLRNDLPAKITIFMKDIFEYAHKGAKIMIKNGWMEEPPQMEERNQMLK